MAAPAWPGGTGSPGNDAGPVESDDAQLPWVDEPHIRPAPAIFAPRSESAASPQRVVAWSEMAPDHFFTSGNRALAEARAGASATSITVATSAVPLTAVSRAIVRRRTDAVSGCDTIHPMHAQRRHDQPDVFRAASAHLPVGQVSDSSLTRNPTTTHRAFGGVGMDYPNSTSLSSFPSLAHEPDVFSPSCIRSKPHYWSHDERQ